MSTWRVRLAQQDQNSSPGCHQGAYSTSAKNPKIRQKNQTKPTRSKHFFPGSQVEDIFFLDGKNERFSQVQTLPGFWKKGLTCLTNGAGIVTILMHLWHGADQWHAAENKSLLTPHEGAKTGKASPELKAEDTKPEPRWNGPVPRLWPRPAPYLTPAFLWTVFCPQQISGSWRLVEALKREA